MKLPASLKSLVIENSDTPEKMLDLVSRNNSALNKVVFVSSKFGKTQAMALKDFSELERVDLVKIDLKEDAFEGLALLSQLNGVGIERCKFPAAAFLDFQRARPRLVGRFTAKAFLGLAVTNQGCHSGDGYNRCLKRMEIVNFSRGKSKGKAFLSSPSCQAKRQSERG